MSARWLGFVLGLLAAVVARAHELNETPAPTAGLDRVADEIDLPLPPGPGDWLAAYAALARLAPQECVPPNLPRLAGGTPAQAFVLDDVGRGAAKEPRIVYTGDPVAERFIVLAQDARGCIHVGVSGRLLPFDARSLPSPFPNTRLPELLGPVAPVAIVADAKSLRPWVNLRSESAFRSLSNRTWLLLGLFLGMLPILLIVGVVVLLYRRSALTAAYVFYISTLLIYQVEALGIGSAWLPFWPSPGLSRVLHSVGVGLVSAGIGSVVIAFLRPRGLLRLTIVGGVALACAGFFSATIDTAGHRLGAGVLMLLAFVVLVVLARRLPAREPAMRWFAVGLAAATTGGGVQAATIFANGAGLPAVTAFAFPIGNSIEAICWLMALMSRLHAENKALHRRLVYDATHDPLTGSYGRGWLRQRMEALLVRARTDPARHYSVLFIDLDGFKLINDRLGHAVGDRVLDRAARALSELVSEADGVGRFGGDEFVILMRADVDACVAEGAAAAVVARFREPLDVGGLQVRIGASVGIVTVDAGYEDVDRIVADADTALYVAKHRGGACFVRFERRMRDDAERRVHLRLDLETALDERQLLLHYQPVFDLGTMMPVGFEALLRWRRDNGSLLPAADFLPAASEAGLLRQIGAQVIDMAFAQVSRWQKEGLWRPGQYLSLNVWGQQLVDDSLIEQLGQAFDRYPVDPSSLRLEIAEHAVRAETELAKRIVPRLLGQEVLVGLDGFGTGLSSLTLAAELKPDLIKLAPSIVEGVVPVAQAQDLARTARALAAELGCLVVATGIETREQLSLLQTLGFDCGQGQFLAAPMPADEIPVWLDLHRRQQPDATRPRSHKQLH